MTKKGAIRSEETKKKDKAYKKAFIKLRHDAYIGVCTCPSCGKRGYMARMKTVNIKTGHVRKWKTFAVHHYVMVNGKAVWNTCFAGVAPGDILE